MQLKVLLRCNSSLCRGSTQQLKQTKARIYCFPSLDCFQFGLSIAELSQETLQVTLVGLQDHETICVERDVV